MKNENETKHSPTPWRIGQTDPEDPWTLCVEDANGVQIYTVASGAESMQQNIQNINDAAHIIECVNAHERLVAENKRLRDALVYISSRAEVGKHFDPPAENVKRHGDERPTSGEAIGNLLLSIAARIEAAHVRELQAEQETAENAICKWSMAEERLRRALPFISEQLCVLREAYEGWKGREETAHAKQIKADIDECEAILEEAEGGV